MSEDKMKINIGRVQPYYCGEWDSSKEYHKLDHILYSGSTYVALKTVPYGVAPLSDRDENEHYWQLIASQGEQGPKGPKGDESAYDAAVEGGYTGTEEEFNATLGKIDTALYVSDVDAEMSGSSTNPVQNKVVTAAVDGKAPVIYDTASGSVASFPDGADSMPLKSLVLNFEPVQDLHGYDSPWPGGGGKNKLKNNLTSGELNGITATVDADGVISFSGTANAITVFNINAYIDTEFSKNTNYVLSGCTGGGFYTYRLEIYKRVGNNATNFNGDTQFQILDTDSDCVCRIVIQAGVNMSGIKIYPMIRLATETDATYAPYSNLCPISGWTGCNVTRAGKNLQPPFTPETKNGLTLTANADGSFTLTGEFTRTSANYMSTSAQFMLPAGTYYSNGALNSSYQYQLSDVTDPTNVRTINRTSNGPDTVGSFFTLEQDTLCTGRVYINYTSGMPAPEGGKMYPMIRRASDADYSFTPYQSQVYPVTFPSEAGTVYGGTLDVTSGVLTATYGDVDMGTLGWTAQDVEHVFRCNFSNRKYGTNDQGIYGICDSYSFYGNASFSVLKNNLQNGQFGLQATNNGVVIRNDSCTTAEQIKSALTGVYLVYPLATPQTYQLTPEEVTTLLGINNIWADCGPVSVEYPADTQLYIQKIDAPIQAELDVLSGKVTQNTEDIADLDGELTRQKSAFSGYAKIGNSEDKYNLIQRGNIFPLSFYQWHYGSINTYTGEDNNESKKRLRSDYIDAVSETEYKTEGTGYLIIHFYKADKSHIGMLGTSYSVPGFTFTTPEDTAYIRFLLKKNFEGNEEFDAESISNLSVACYPVVNDLDSALDAIDNLDTALDSAVDRIEILEEDAVDLLDLFANKVNGVSKGITWTWDDDKKAVTANGTGTGTSSDPPRNTIYNSVLPDCIKPGNIYRVNLTTEDENLKFRITFYDGNSTTLAFKLINTNGTHYIYCPANTATMSARFQTPATASIENKKISATLQNVNKAETIIHIPCCTYNVGRYNYGYTPSSSNPVQATSTTIAEMKEYFRTHPVDIFALQEGQTEIVDSDLTTTTNANTAIYNYLYPNNISSNTSGYPYSPSLYCKYPIISSGTGTMTDNRPYAWAIINVHGIPVFVMSVHLSLTYENREYNYSEIATLVSQYKHWIVLGDLNAGNGVGESGWDAQPEYTAILNRGWHTANGSYWGLINTYCASSETGQARYLDSVLTSPNIDINTYEAPWLRQSMPSDHRPMMCNLTLYVN